MRNFFLFTHFVKLWELVDLRAFSPRPVDFHLCPAPRIFTLAPPRPAEKKAAPHIPDLHIYDPRSLTLIHVCIIHMYI